MDNIIPYYFDFNKWLNTIEHKELLLSMYFIDELAYKCVIDQNFSYLKNEEFIEYVKRFHKKEVETMGVKLRTIQDLKGLSEPYNHKEMFLMLRLIDEQLRPMFLEYEEIRLLAI